MTLRLKADFFADWNAHLRTLLLAQGWSNAEVEEIPDADVAARFFDASRRKIAVRPRAVELADDFSCPPDHQAGWDALHAKIRDGLDLNPHLSLQHASLHNLDGLLAEWGVHHFHLGVGPHLRNPAFTERTRPVVFGLVTDSTFHAINVFSHGRGYQPFTDNSVLESIHRNWPNLIEKYRAKAVTGEAWTPEQRKHLRSSNANVVSKVADGTAYIPIAGGVMASGVSAEAMRAADAYFYRIRRLQGQVESKLNTEILPALRLNGYSDAPEVHATLQVTEAGDLQVYIPKYDVIVRTEAG